MREGLAEAYGSCRRMQRRHDPTYWVATGCLPADVRPAVHALYGFVRGADEIVDGRERLPRPEDRRVALDAWHAELLEGLDAGGSDHPVIAALVDAGRRHALPLHELDRYMASMRRDCGPVRITCADDLEDYMQGSAAAVGRIMAPLLGAPPAAADAFARLGTAFQLTNFIRDVREDWTLDRLYLPAEDRARFGVEEEDIARGRATPGFRALLAQEVALARARFAETAVATVAVHRRLRPGIRLARGVYLRVLDRVERNGFDVLGRRADLSPLEAGVAAARGAVARAA